MELKTNLKNKWNIWYHHEKDNWKISGYNKIYEIETISDFWCFYNNWNKVGGVTNKHFFIIQDGITPIWEDPKNINGGCWSYKIHEDNNSLYSIGSYRRDLNYFNCFLLLDNCIN